MLLLLFNFHLNLATRSPWLLLLNLDLNLTARGTLLLLNLGLGRCTWKHLL